MYKRLLFSIVLSIVSLILLRGLWYKEGITLSFASIADTAVEYQVFWGESPTSVFSEKNSIRKVCSKRTRFVEIFIPTKKIDRFRLDFGRNPVRVSCSNMLLSGSEKMKLPLNRFTQKNIRSFRASENRAELDISSNDPYIVYDGVLNFCSTTHRILWFPLTCIAVLPIYLTCVLSDMWKLRKKRKTSSPPVLMNLEFLRVVFTLGVLCVHFFPPFKIWNGGGQCVPFFFMLSGYLLAVSFRPERSLFDMALSRWIRFTPLVVAGGIMVGGEWAAFDGVFMLQNTGLTFGDIPNAPAWYIGVLFWCTLFYVGVMKAFTKKQSLLIVAVVGFICLLILIHNGGSRDAIRLNFITVGMLRGIECMAVGILLAHICRRVVAEELEVSRRLVYTIAEVCVIGYIFWGFFDLRVYSSLESIQNISHVALLALFVKKRGYLTSLLECKAFVFLSRYSLSIYLTHWIINKPVQSYMLVNYPGWIPQHPVMSLACAFSLAIIIGVLAHHFIEKPCTRYLTNFINWMKQGVVNKVH